MRTSQGKTRTGIRVSSLRRVRKIEGYRSTGTTGGEWLTISEPAAKFGATNYKIRRIVEAGLLSTEQVMVGAPIESGLRTSRSPKSKPRSCKKARVALKTQTTRIPIFNHFKR